jgi:DNA-binding HxlR family transcriptional regulator
MTEDNKWKLVVDSDGLTIASDRFHFTANGPRGTQTGFASDDELFESADSSEIESLISELQSMTRRSFGQFCGLSRAFELVGERWAMLIIRDLLVSPKSVTDLQRGLPRVPAAVLCARLDELQRAGVIARSSAKRSDGTVVYELTEWGNELEDIILRLGRWGARMLREPGTDEIVTPDSMVMALRATFVPEAAMGLHVSYELRLDGIVIHAHIDDGAIQVGKGPLPGGADLVIETGKVLKDLMTRELSAADAIADGLVTLTGDHDLLARFTELFFIPGAVHPV